MRHGFIVVASTRAATGVYDDATGPMIEAWMTERNFTAQTRVVPDGDEVGRAIAEGIAGDADLIVTTGGTGVSPTDATPEQTAPLLDRELPGIAEELRRRGLAGAGAASLLSRGRAGVAGRTLVVNLPGSPGGVRDGLGVLGEILEHTLDQLRGADHARRDGGHHD